MPILSGSTNTEGATLITIPAGEVWQGSLSISLGSTVDSFAVIQVADGGTGEEPVAGTSLVGTCVKLALLSAAQNSVSVSDVFVKAGDAAVNLKLLYFGGGSRNVCASATGAY